MKKIALPGPGMLALRLFILGLSWLHAQALALAARMVKVSDGRRMAMMALELL